MLSFLLTSKSPSFSQLDLLNTECDITWSRISRLISWFGFANRVLVKVMGPQLPPQDPK